MVHSNATHIDPKEYFNPNAERPPKSLIGQYWLRVSIPSLLFFSQALANALSKRPLVSGVHRYVTGVVGGAVAGHYIDKTLKRRLAERDLFYYQYMCDHPEDFEPVARKKFGDVFMAWHPRR